MEENTIPSHKMKASRHISEETVASGQWLSLNRVTYKDPNDTERIWEVVHRTSRVPGSSSDVVFIIAKLRRLVKFDCMVLVKQYRPPVRGYTIEFPAGLIDAGEDASKAALRELREETGYTGVVQHVSPVACTDPGICDTMQNMVTVEIDGDDPVNVNPSNSPDETEFIEVLTVPLDRLLESLNKYSEEGFIVHGLLYTYAIAMAQTRA